MFLQKLLSKNVLQESLLNKNLVHGICYEVGIGHCANFESLYINLDSWWIVFFFVDRWDTNENLKMNSPSKN